MNNDSGFVLGRRCSMAFYILGCLLILIIGAVKQSIPRPLLIAFTVYAVATILIMLFRRKLRFSDNAYKIMQCLLFAAQNIFLSVAFDSAQVFVYATFLDVVVSFIFLDPKFAKFQMIVSTSMLVMMTVVIIVFVKSAQSLIEFILGASVTFITSWAVVAMSSMIRYQHRRMLEQERSLDDMLKVVEAKCDEARQATRSKTRFLANMSHEIRTPINSVIGMNEMILRESSEPEIRSYAADANSAAQSLLSIINDILDITKVEEGKIELSPINYSLPKLISDVYNLIRFRALSKDLKFEVVVDENLPSGFFGDDIRLKQILVNLLNNAMKYTHEGSVVLSVTGQNGILSFSVKDTGIGIKEENIGRLFNAFYRTDDIRNRNIEGTGLGLSITQSILELLDSELKVRSVYGQGSEFYFTIEQCITDLTPIGKLKLDDSEYVDQKYTVDFEAPSAKVLVVDDNDMNRKVLRQLLKMTKIQVEEASGGKEAVEMAKTQRYDLIFMDHMMPEMDGIEAFHCIRDDKNSACCDVPIIVLTANAVIGAEEYYMSEGFNGFITKPVDSVKLDDMIISLLDKKLIKQVKYAAPKAQKDIELPLVEGIDWAYTRAKLPSDEMIPETIKTFCKAAHNDINELSSYFSDIDSERGIDSYRIKVHSMKASALIIGAVQAAGMAMRLEKAARAGERGIITAIHPVFAQCWIELAAALKSAFPDDRERLDATEHADEIQALYSDIRAAAEDMDVDRLDDIADKLDGYVFTGDRAAEVERIKSMILNFEIEKLMELTW